MRTYKEPKLDKFRKPPLCIPTPPEEPEECENKTCIEKDLLEIPKTLHSENNINVIHLEAKNGHEDKIVDSPPLEEDVLLEVKKAKLDTVNKQFTNCTVEQIYEEKSFEVDNNTDVKRFEVDKEVKETNLDSVNGDLKESKLDNVENISIKRVETTPQKIKKQSPRSKKVLDKKIAKKACDKDVAVEESADVNCQNVKKKLASQKKKPKKTFNNDSGTIHCEDAGTKLEGSESTDVKRMTNKIQKNKSKTKVKKDGAAEGMKSEQTVKVEPESLEHNNNNQLSTPPRLKRTPKKNRKYQSDDENGKGKSPVTQELSKKSNRPSTPRKRKLNFEEDKSEATAGDEGDKPTPRKKTKKMLQVNQEMEMETKKSEELMQNKIPKKKKVRKNTLAKKDQEDGEENDECSQTKPRITKKKRVKKADLGKISESGKNEDSNKENDDGKEINSGILSENRCENGTTGEVDAIHEGPKHAEVIPKSDASETPKPKKKIIRKKKVKKPEIIESTENLQNCDTAAIDCKDEQIESTENDPTKHPKEKREPIPCNHCGHVAGGRAALTRHLKKCPRVNQSDDPETKELIVGPYKCEQCDYSAKKRAMLARHLTIHNQFICLRCPFVGDTRDSWQEHMKADHKDRADQKLCKMCSRYIKCNETPLEKHMAECKGRTPFTCSLCDKEFKYESSLKSHMISHNPNEPKRFHCTSCEYESNYKANLKKHLKNLHEERIRNIQCPKCDKLFYTEDNMRRHLKLHSQDRPFVCPKCNKTFKTRASLRGHIIVHDPTRPFKCGIDECTKDFRTSKLLKNHQEEFHNLSTKKFHCSADGCNFSFFKRSHLERHEITHTGERKFICPWADCARPFRHRDNLKVHMRQHTNEKPVKCDSCDFACRQRSSLHWHKKKCHPEQPSENSNSTDCTEIQNEAVQKGLLAPEDPELSDQKTLSPGNSSQNLMDLYEFKSDDDSGNESAPSLLGRDKEKLPPHVDFSSAQLIDFKLETGPCGREIKSELEQIKTEDLELIDKHLVKDTELPPVKQRKKPGPKPKVKNPDDPPVKKKSPGRKKKINPEAITPPIKKKPGRKKKIKTEEVVINCPKKKVVRKKKKEILDKHETKTPDESKCDSERDVAEKVAESLIKDIKPEDSPDLSAVIETRCSDQTEDVDKNQESISDNEPPKVNEESKEEIDLVKKLDQSPNEKQENDSEQKLEQKPEEALKENHDKQSIVDSDRSSDIESDFEDYKPPPAPRPPPICDSDEGDIESGPENEEPDSSRSFEMPPLDLSSTVKNEQQDLKKEKDIEIEAKDHEVKNESNPSVSDNVSNEVPESSVPVPVPVPEADDLQGTLLVAQDSDIQQHGTAESFGEDSLSQVDKSYFDQYLPQFHHSVSQEMPEEEPKDMTLEVGEKSVERVLSSVVEQCVVEQCASDKEINPLSAAPEELQTCSPEEDPNMSHKRMEILTTDREQEDHFQPRTDTSVPVPTERTDNVYEGFNSINPFMPTSRDTTILRQNDNIFASSSSAPSFVRFSENDAVLARQRVATPFLPEHNSLQNLHRIADTALSQHNNPSLLRRPTTVPTREEIFPAPPTPLPQTMTRNPFHNSWSSQEVRPPHWGQAPYLQRPIDRQTAPTSSGLFSKDNYLSGRDFMFDASCRSITERNMFASLSSPQPQRTELPHESFQLERFDIGGYFSSHGYSAPTALDYTRPTCNSSQKSLDDRYRQTAGMTDFRTLPQTSTSDMFGSINMNSSFNLDKFVYPRDPVYHPPHVTESTNSAFLTHSLPAQHSMFERDYPPRGFYHQSNPYSFMNDKQYAAAAAASAKLTHPASAVPQERDLLPRPNTTADNQMQDPYRHHTMIYNMMNRYFE